MNQENIKDNWKNKQKEMICATCMYYINFRCRRHSPTITGYPAIYPNDWCGDHKMDKQTMISIKSEIKHES